MWRVKAGMCQAHSVDVRQTLKRIWELAVPYHKKAKVTIWARHSWRVYTIANMLRKNYARFGRLAYKTINPFTRLYMTSKHHRVRVLLINELGEVLLVRSWLGHQNWSLPGGGIRRREIPVQAAVRELQEETGVTLAQKDLKHLGEFINPYKEASFTIICFAATIKKQPAKHAWHRQLEVLDSGWFRVKRLPKACSPTVKKALSLL